MSNYQILCDSCGAEYQIEIVETGTESVPIFCACCGEQLEDVVSVDALDYTDDSDEWDKLIEDVFDEDDEEWKDRE
jgi:hypothetical protein